VLYEIGVGEHDGDVRYLTGSRIKAVLRMRNEKYVIWPIFMAESPKYLALSYGRIAKIAAQLSNGLVNSAMGQIPCSTERISSSF